MPWKRPTPPGLIVVGVADETVDNSSGANGAATVKLRRKRGFLFKNSATAAVTQASVGSNVYVEDDETVALAAGPDNDIVAGKCLEVADRRRLDRDLTDNQSPLNGG